MARKSSIIGGIIAFLLAFIYKLPIYPPNNLSINFKIFTLDNVEYYFWGYLIDGKDSYLITSLQAPESYPFLAFWLIIIFIGISSIIASTNNIKMSKSRKLYRVNIILCILILLIFGIIIYVASQDIVKFISVAGYGYYFTLLIMLLNIIAILYLGPK